MCPSLYHLQTCFHHPPLQFVVPYGTLERQSGFIIYSPLFCVCHSCIQVCKERKPYHPNQIHISFYAVACKWINIQCSLTHWCTRAHMHARTVGGAVRQAYCGWWMVALLLQSGSALLLCMFYAHVPAQYSQTSLLGLGVCLCFHLSGSLFVCAWAELFRSERSFLLVLMPVAISIWSDKLQCLYEWDLSQFQTLPTTHLLSGVGNAALKLVCVPFWRLQPYEWWTARNRPDGKGEQKPTHRFLRCD